MGSKTLFDAAMEGQASGTPNLRQAVPFFNVKDIEASLRFYVDGLGFAITRQWNPGGRLRWCWLELDGVAIILQEYWKEDSRVDGLQAFWGGECPSVSCVRTPLPCITIRKQEASTRRDHSWATISGSHRSLTRTGTAWTSRVQQMFLKRRSIPIRHERCE